LAKEFPLISIVTPSLNQGEYIEENIKSVLNQKYPNFEHIIIDGDSIDGTIDILKKYKHLIWVSKKDSGQSEAINKGIKRAKGEIIGWLNSDDFYEPNVFFTIVKELNRDECKYIVFGDCYAVDEKGRMPAYYKAKLPHSKNWFKYWKKDYVIHSAAVFFYRDVFEKIGYFDESLHYTMDDDYWLRVNRYYQFHQINKPIANIRFHHHMKTISRDEMFEREWFTILKKNWPDLPFIDRYYHLLMALSYRSNSMRMNAYSKMGELSSREFRKEIFLALIINPLNLFKIKFMSALFRTIFGHRFSNLIKTFFIKARAFNKKYTQQRTE